MKKMYLLIVFVIIVIGALYACSDTSDDALDKYTFECGKTTEGRNICKCSNGVKNCEIESSYASYYCGGETVYISDVSLVSHLGSYEFPIMTEINCFEQLYLFCEENNLDALHEVRHGYECHDHYGNQGKIRKDKFYAICYDGSVVIENGSEFEKDKISCFKNLESYCGQPEDYDNNDIDSIFHNQYTMGENECEMSSYELYCSCADGYGYGIIYGKEEFIVDPNDKATQDSLCYNFLTKYCPIDKK